MGWAPRATLRMSCTGTIEALLASLNQRTDPSGPMFSFECHASQSWKLSFPAWLHAASPDLVPERWEPHVMREPIVLTIRQADPDFKMSLFSQITKVSAREPFPKKDDRVYSWHVACKPQHHDQTIRALRIIYKSSRKTDFPGCQK
jgi:hypothetical protein